HVGDVSAGGLAHLGDRVDEGDLGGQERVGGGLDQLGGLVAHDQAGRLALEHAGVDAVQHRHGPLGGGGARLVHAVDQPVRVQGVLYREPLAQELRVPQQVRAVDGREPLGEQAGGAGGNVRLADHERGRAVTGGE